MDAKTQKEIIVNQLEQIEDPELILAVKHLLEYGLKKQVTDPAFIGALERALRQSEQGEGRSHESVKQDFRNRYSA